MKKVSLHISICIAIYSIIFCNVIFAEQFNALTDLKIDIKVNSNYFSVNETEKSYNSDYGKVILDKKGNILVPFRVLPELISEKNLTLQWNEINQ